MAGVCSGVEAAPAGNVAPLIPGTQTGLLAGMSDDVPRIKFSKKAKVLFSYKCPVGGLDNRILTLKVNFDGSRTTIEDAGAAEIHVVRHVEGLTDTSYRVNSFVGHNMCLARAGFRYCGYSMTTTLQADADEKSLTAKFDVPRTAGMFNIIPSVTEACTPLNGHLSDCKKANNFVACELVNVFALPASRSSGKVTTENYQQSLS